jgi:hypothetical protein
MTPPPKREVLPRCQWCFKYNRTASEYEQRTLKGAWHRLCVRCANIRLRNPYNALLPMRKIGSEKKEDEGL